MRAFGFSPPRTLFSVRSRRPHRYETTARHSEPGDSIPSPCVVSVQVDSYIWAPMNFYAPQSGCSSNAANRTQSWSLSSLGQRSGPSPKRRAPVVLRTAVDPSVGWVVVDAVEEWEAFAFCTSSIDSPENCGVPNSSPGGRRGGISNYRESV